MALLMYGLIVLGVPKDSTRQRITAHGMPSFQIRHGREPLGNARDQLQARAASKVLPLLMYRLLTRER